MMLLLKEKVYNYMKENNPSLVISLAHKKGGVTAYLDSLLTVNLAVVNEIFNQNYQPHETETEVMNLLTADFQEGSSRYELLGNLLRSNYEHFYREFSELGLVTQIIVGLLDFTDKIFDKYPSSEIDKSLNHWLQFELLAAMEEYFSPE